MLCPKCQAEVAEGAAFCGACGASVEQPTQPMSTASAAEQEAYQRQLAEYERQKAAYDQAQYAQQQAAYQQQVAYAAQPAPPKKRKTGCIIAVVLLLLFLCVGCSVGGYFGYKWLQDNGGEIPGIEIGDPAEDDSDWDSGDSLESYATADEAVMAALESSGSSDWVYELVEEGEGWATYWAGPPNSEYVDEIYVEQNSDGSWSVLSVSSIGDYDFGGEVTGAADEAMAVVDEHLWYVSIDDGLSAQALTVDPFHADSASAQVSAGGFDSYAILGYTEESDGTFWVQTEQTWYGSTEYWDYWVVPTEAGYRIADIR